MQETEAIKEIIQQVDKWKLIDIISSVYYYDVVTEECSSNSIFAVELEYMLKLIYETPSTEEREPSAEEVMLLFNLTEAIIRKKNEEDSKQLKQGQENIIFTHARNNFLYVKEDTQYQSMVFDYLNLFHPVEYFFKMYYSFTIEDFLHFTAYIQIEYVNRIKLIEQFLKQTHEKVTRKILIEYLMNCCILNFNEATLTSNREEQIAFQNILKKFSTNKEIEKEFETYPIYQKGNTYILSSIVTLVYHAKSIFEKEIRADRILGNVYADKKGEYLEILTQNVMQDILKDAQIYPNIQYRENKQNRECDLLVIYDQIILIVEIKSRALKQISKEGSKNFLEQDLNDNLYKAYDQATRMEKYLQENKNVILRFGNQKNTLNIENTDKFKIFKIGITLENFRTYAIQYSNFHHIGSDMLFLNINDLKLMSKYFRYQTEFVHYISQRIKTNQYIHKFYLYDELYLFSEYKINNLQGILNNDHTIRTFDHERGTLFDFRFHAEEKEKILTGKMHPFFDKMIKELETKKLPTYELTIMDLLDLDTIAQEKIFRQLATIRAQFKEMGPQLQCISVDEDRDVKGMGIVLAVTDCNNHHDAIQWSMIIGSMFKRKHPSYEVIGMMSSIENKEEDVDVFRMMEPKAQIDDYINQMEELKEWYMKM